MMRTAPRRRSACCPGVDSTGIEAAALRDATAQLDRDALTIRYCAPRSCLRTKHFSRCSQAPKRPSVRHTLTADVRFDRISAAIAAEPDPKEEP